MTHDYLGMTLDFSEVVKFIINMEECLNEILSGFPEDTNRVAATSGVGHLFKTHNSAYKQNKERAELFHHFTARIMFVEQVTGPTCGQLYHS